MHILNRAKTKVIEYLKYPYKPLQITKMPEISIGSEPGTYLLILRNSQRKSISIGKLGTLCLTSGYYLYVGSAFGPGGLQSRVSRHLKRQKKLRWHIDYLRHFTQPHAVLLSRRNERLEKSWVCKLCSIKGFKVPMPGFGASDSRAVSHLFHTPEDVDLNMLSNLLAPDHQTQLFTFET